MLWNVITVKLRKGSDNARGDDTASLKKLVIPWISQLFGPPDPPLDPKVKSDRGLDHDSTGRLLCPSEFDWQDIR
jgi:hypothetical protein